ncbi:MAG: hypothetical protein ACJ8AO_07415 [Gemmatimonadaceae bacterium]
MTRALAISLVHAAAACALAACGGPRPASDLGAPAAGRADAHVHLSYEGPAALDSLLAHGVTAARDCGGDLAELSRWRSEIAAGTRRGPRLYLAGPVLDGPKEGARFRVTVTTPEEAERAVDSLADLGVDFIKTHTAVPPAAFFATIRRARARGLKVAAHLPRGVPAWTAADSGVGSIEHMAESIVQSPIYARLARDAREALEWWRSPAGDSMMVHLARTGVYVTPTLVYFEANIATARTPAVREGRAALLPELVALTGRLHRAGVPLLVGTDVSGPEIPDRPGASVDRELELLRQAGIPDAAVREAASARRLAEWFRPPRSP